MKIDRQVEIFGEAGCENRNKDFDDNNKDSIWIILWRVLTTGGTESKDDCKGMKTQNLLIFNF